MAELSAEAQRLRNQILDCAHLTGALEIANTVTNEALDRFNDFADEHTVITSLLARALHVRAHVSIAAEWMADVTKVPAPICYEVIRDLVANPPSCVVERHWNEDEEGTKH